MRAAMKRLLLCFLAACSGGSSPDPATIPDAKFPPFSQCAQETCAAGSTITAPGQLVSIINASEWTPEGPYTAGCLPASSNVHAEGTLTIDEGAIAVPAWCDASGCRQLVTFKLTGAAPGVDCLGAEQWFDFTLCKSIALHDTTVRLRMLQLDIHPSDLGNFAPIVEVVPACEASCGTGELACEETHTCWGSVRDHCAYCLGGTNEMCACWDGAAFQADGTACDFFVSGDVVESGMCHAGTCRASH